MAHCDEYLELISASLDGALSPAEQEKLNSHLSVCPECQGLYDDFAALRTALAELPLAESPEDLKGRVMDAVVAQAQDSKAVPFAPSKKKAPSFRWQRWLASAAAIAIVILGTWSWKPWETDFDQLSRTNETSFLDRGAGGTPFTSAGAAPTAPTPAPSSLPEPASVPAEAAAKAEETVPFSDKPRLGDNSLEKFKDATAEMGDDGYTSKSSLQTAAPSDSGISSLFTEAPEETLYGLYGFTSVGQAPDAAPPQDTSLPEDPSALLTVPTEANGSAAGNAGDSQPTAMPRLFSIGPAVQYVPFPGEEGILEQSVASQAEAVSVLANYIYEFVGEVELVEDGLSMNYAVNSPTGISGTVACVGEDEDVYFLNYRDDLSPNVLNYSVRKDSGQVTLLGQETSAAVPEDVTVVEATP